MINRERMTKRFKRFAETDSVSREEGALASDLASLLKSMGAQVVFDRAGDAIGSESGNLIARFAGNVAAEPIFLSGHMDTVEPGRGVKVRFENGVFKSQGDTILGSDDKSALVIILEALDIIIENSLACPPIEIVFTVCEEIGLLGAKHLDMSLMSSTMGYILDSTDLEGIVTRAPAANRFSIRVHGKDAHAGAYPERGINAISVASRAVSALQLGRLDHETTCNMGVIQGGKATNIVPDLVEIEGEARSHDTAKLKAVTESVIKAFSDAADWFRKDGNELPRVDVSVIEEFPATNIPEDHRIVTLARAAAENLGFAMEPITIGGGADANIFFGKGIMAGVLGTGMTDVHTVRESISLEDMEKTTSLVLEIIRIHAAGGNRFQ